MLKCKQIIELSSKQIDTHLPWYQRLEFKLHLLMCKSCNLYSRQINFIQYILSNLDQHGKNLKLPEDAKKRIANKIKLYRNQKPD